MIFFEKALLIAQMHTPLFGGTLLHLAILKKGNSEKVSITGAISLAIICALTGLFFRYTAVAYYAYIGVSVQQEVLDFLMFFGGMIGYSGLMWAGGKVEDVWLMGMNLTKYGIKAAINYKYDKKDNSSNNDRYTPDNYERPRYEESDYSDRRTPDNRNRMDDEVTK